MEKETQNRINALMSLYFSRVRVDDGLKKEFHDWFENNGHIEYKYRALEMVFNDYLGFDENPSEDVFESFGKICEKLGFSDAGVIPSRHPVSPRRPNLVRAVLLRAAAVVIPLVAASVCGLVFFKVRDPGIESSGKAAALQTQSQEHRAAGRKLVLAGDSERNIDLPDKSNVWINRNSSIEFDGDFTERKVALRGEAYFNVAKAESDFVVQAEELTALVTGTRFNVASHPGSSAIVISLYEGSLAVEKHGVKHYLDAGRELRYDRAADRITIGNLDESLPAWLGRAVGFVETRIEEIFEALETTYGTPIVIDGDERGFADERVTLWLERAITLDGALTLIEQLSGRFTYSHDEETGRMMVMPR